MQESRDGFLTQIIVMVSVCVREIETDKVLVMERERQRKYRGWREQERV